MGAHVEARVEIKPASSLARTALRRFGLMLSEGRIPLELDPGWSPWTICM